MTAPDPRANPLLLGHDGAEATLAEAMRSGRMHHAWLLTGPEGIGKATLAFRFARRLLAGAAADGTLAMDRAGPSVPPRRRRLARRPADDRARLEREDASGVRSEIVVDDVRRVPDFLHLTPAEGGWRVVVIDGAEDLNRNAANALLKVLEEPPRARHPAAGVLRRRPPAADHPQPLPPAAPGRCSTRRRWPTCWRAICPTRRTEERGRLVTLGEGSIGRALQLAEGGAVAVADMVGSVLEALPALPPMTRP